VPDVRDELSAFLATWLPAVREERTRAFKANLAFLLDLVVQRGLELEIRRLRDVPAGPEAAGVPHRGAAETVLAVLRERAASQPRGRSSRSGAGQG